MTAWDTESGRADISGTPVIASDCAGNVGLLGPDYPGLFPVGDVDAARALLLRAEGEPGFYRTLVAAARLRAAR